jgi:hypothetical protein
LNKNQLVEIKTRNIMNDTKDNTQHWSEFQATNRQRRAIRLFNDSPIAEDDIYALISEAILAPSSVNLQPYQFHWVRNPAKKTDVAQACNGQKAAATAAEIIVVVANTNYARSTISEQLASMDVSTTMPEKSKDYHRKILTKFDKILKIGGYRSGHLLFLFYQYFVLAYLYYQLAIWEVDIGPHGTLLLQLKH